MENDVTKIQVSSKYLDGLVTLFGGIKLKRALGELVVDEKVIEDNGEISKFRSGVGTLLYLAGDRPDIQYHTKELASKLSSPTKEAMATLINLIGYLLYTKDSHLVMDGRNPSRSFRKRAKGLASTPEYEENKNGWLLEVATDSDWSGNKTSRASTSCGCVFIGGNWVYPYSRTQRNITLSSTASEYVTLVSGECEGLLLKAVLTHLVGDGVMLKLYADNTSAVAVAAKEGVSKIKHLSGKLLWVQQRQGNDFELRKLDTTTNPSDVGTKCLSGKRVKLLLYLTHYDNDYRNLGWNEFVEEKEKKEKRDQLESIRAVIHHEMADTGGHQSSALMNKVAKKLMRLTLAALLADVGEALSLAENGGCLAMLEPTRPSSSAQTIVYVLIFVIVVLTFLVMYFAYKTCKFKYLNEYHRGMVREVRAILKEEGQRRDRLRARRAERQARVARLGITLNEEAEEESNGFIEDEEVHIRSVKLEMYADGMEEEQFESENEMAVDEEIDNDALDLERIWGLLDRNPPGDDGGEDADVESAGVGGADLESISVRGTSFDYDYEEPEVDEMQEDQEESESYGLWIPPDCQRGLRCLRWIGS